MLGNVCIYLCKLNQAGERENRINIDRKQKQVEHRFDIGLLHFRFPIKYFRGVLCTDRCCWRNKLKSMYFQASRCLNFQ